MWQRRGQSRCRCGEGELYGGPCPFQVLEELERFQREDPKATYFKPAQLLVDCVKANQSLAQFWAKNGSKYPAGSPVAASKSKL